MSVTSTTLGGCVPPCSVLGKMKEESMPARCDQDASPNSPAEKSFLELLSVESNSQPLYDMLHTINHFDT